MSILASVRMLCVIKLEDSSTHGNVGCALKKVKYMPGGIGGVATGSVQVSIRGLAAFAIDLVVSPAAQKKPPSFRLKVLKILLGE
jgi:hypothetical protein